MILSCLYILEIDPFSVASFANIFSHSEGCLFTLFIASFAVPRASLGSDGKKSACNVGDLGLIPGLGRSPGGREWQHTPVFLPREFHGHRSLAGYSPWGRKESD